MLTPNSIVSTQPIYLKSGDSAKGSTHTSKVQNRMLIHYSNLRQCHYDLYFHVKTSPDQHTPRTLRLQCHYSRERMTWSESQFRSSADVVSGVSVVSSSTVGSQSGMPSHRITSGMQASSSTSLLLLRLLPHQNPDSSQMERSRRGRGGK